MDVIETVYRERYARFVRLAHAITGDEQAALDAVHDAFVRAVRHRRSLRDARTARRRRVGVRVAFALAAAVAVVVAFAGTPASRLDRALAATGTGDVLYFVFETTRHEWR